MPADRSPRPPRATLGHGDLSRGTDQSGVRLYNERLVLSLIRGHGSLPQAEISRLTGLSPQTCSVIMKQLEADGIVRRGAPVKGRIGQPSVPFSLDPDGAFAVGLKIGRRSSDLILIDLVGGVRHAAQETYAYPTPDTVLRFVDTTVAAVIASAPQPANRVAGLGIAVPNKLWSWHEEIGAPQSVLNDWRDFDVAGELARISDWPLHMCNDATAACAAELTFGNPTGQSDFIYFYIGTFVGGGVALNGSLYTGPTGNAGALGPMPIATDQPGPNGQLIHVASLYILEDRLREAGHDPSIIWRSPSDWSDMGPLLDEWIDNTCRALALGVLSAITVIDFGAAIIDGAMPQAVRRRIVDGTTARLDELDRRGLSPVTLLEGTIGAGAQAKGAASLPLLANFARNRDVLFKDRVAG